MYDVSRDLVPKVVLNSLGKKYRNLVVTSPTRQHVTIDEEAVRGEKFEEYVTKLMLKGIPPNNECDEDRVMTHVVFCKLIGLMIKLYKLRASEARKMNCFEVGILELMFYLLY